VFDFFSDFLSSLNEDRSGDGRQALYKKVIQSLSTESDPEVKSRLLRLALDVPPRRRSQLKLSRSIEIRPFLSVLLDSRNNDYQKTAQEFIAQFSDRKFQHCFIYKHLKPLP
jgi:hypothetical protein